MRNDRLRERKVGALAFLGKSKFTPTLPFLCSVRHMAGADPLQPGDIGAFGLGFFKKGSAKS